MLAWDACCRSLIHVRNYYWQAPRAFYCSAESYSAVSALEGRQRARERWQSEVSGKVHEQWNPEEREAFKQEMEGTLPANTSGTTQATLGVSFL